MEINWNLFEQYNALDARQRQEALPQLNIHCKDPEIINILSKSHFVIPGKTRFSCQMCGECCRYARKIANLTYEPCVFLTDKNKCSKHDNRYLVCMWFPFYIYKDPHYGKLLTIKPYCSGYGKGSLVDYDATIKRISNLESTAKSESDGAFVIHEVLYLPEKKEWTFPSKVNIDRLLKFINDNSSRNIEEHKRTITNELQYAQHFTNYLLGGINEPQATINENGLITDLNDAFANLFELPKQELINKLVYNYFVNPEKAKQNISICLTKGRLNAIPERLKVKSLTKNLLVNAVTFRSRADGMVHGLLVCMNEVSENIYAEINHSKNYARGLLEASLDFLVFLDKDGIISDVNEACCNILGMKRENIIGTRFVEYFDNPQKANEGINLTYKNGFVKNYVLNLVKTIDGTISVSFNATLYKDADGIVCGIYASARDIRETQLLINELEKSKNYARSLIESSLDLMVTISKNGMIQDVNEAACRLTGVKREKLIGTLFNSYFQDAEKAKKGIELTFEKGKVESYELILINHKKEKIEVSFNASLYKEITGEVAGIFAIARDISEQTKIKKELEALKTKH